MRWLLQIVLGARAIGLCFGCVKPLFYFRILEGEFYLVVPLGEHFNVLQRGERY